MKRSADLILGVRIYGRDAHKIALRYRNREAVICPVLGIVVWRVDVKIKRSGR